MKLGADNNWANLVSVSRIPIGTIVALLIVYHTLWSYIAALILITIGELTDYADGKLARRSNKWAQVSDLGKILDPLSDSLFRAIIFCAFLSVDLIPLWLLIIVVARDIVVSYVRVFTQQKGYTMAALISGKIKAVVQAVCIFTIILQQIFLLANYGGGIAWVLLFDFVKEVSIWVAGTITLWSMVDYIHTGYNAAKDKYD